MGWVCITLQSMNTAPISQFGISLTEDRAAALLGSGIKPEIVASSLGVSHARISQLMSDEAFASRVAELRYQNLAKHNERDDKADSLESRILERLEEEMPIVHRPMELLKMYQVLNAAKRRGASTPEAIVEKQSIVQLVVPIQIINKFQSNAQGQVTVVGDTDLLTIQSGALESLSKERNQKTIQQRVGNLLDSGNELAKERQNGSPAVTIRNVSAEEI